MNSADSADKWGEVGRTAAKLAQSATEKGHFGSAQEFRKNAEQAFNFELQLRHIALSAPQPKQEELK